MTRTYAVVMIGMLFISCGFNTPRFPGFSIPSNFPPVTYHMNNNPITEKGFLLGKTLFYEPRLSRNNTISCAGCHIQSSAFTQHGHDVSHGIDDRLGTRNSPPIMNLAWSGTFMWDGGIFDLDLQPLAPIANHVEMDETMQNVIRKLQSDKSYAGMFTSAFGTPGITSSRILKALSQFMLMCISSNSRYDSVMRGEGSVAFTEQESAGYLIFQKKCATCHTPPLFTDQSFRNNGLSISAVNDKGRFAVTLRPDDQYKFKVPSLRNLAYTAPYMHDGRYLTLNAVLEHYTNSVQRTPGLDALLQVNGRPGISLTEGDKKKLLAFLNTLNDKKFVSDPLFSPQ